MPTPILHHRADRVLGLGDLLGPPVRATVQGEPGRVLYEGWAGIEDVQPYGTGAEYVTRDALESQIPDLIGAPVILGRRGRDGARLHPGQGSDAPAGAVVTAHNARDAGAVGTVVAADVRDLPDGRAGQWVRIAIHDADAIAAIDAGDASGLSSAYSAEIDATPGDFRGRPYAARQTRRVGTHHLLLTDSPRAGSGATLRADAQEPPMPMTPEEIAAVADAVGKAIGPMLDALRADMSAMYKKPDAVEIEVGEEESAPVDMAMLDAAKADAAAQKARADAAEAKVAAFELAQRRADAAPIAAALAARGLKVDGFDAANPTAAGIAAANAALVAALLPRADATGRGPASPPLVKPQSHNVAPTPRALPL